MDSIAHGLWTNALYHRQRSRDRRWAVFFGVAPDLFSFGPFFLSRLLAYRSPVGRLTPPDYVTVLYNYTHSLIIFLVVFLAVAAVRSGKSWWPLAAWGLHILVDILTHTDQYFPTPFLYPLFDFRVSVISWAEPTFMLVNYALLGVVYLELSRRRRSATTP